MRRILYAVLIVCIAVAVSSLIIFLRPIQVSESEKEEFQAALRRSSDEAKARLRAAREENKKIADASRAKKLAAGAAEDAELNRLLDGQLPRQWMLLPGWVNDVRVDSRHRVCLLRKPVQDEYVEKMESTSAVAEGKSHILHVYDLILEDSKGRFYITVGRGDKLEIVDHGKVSTQSLVVNDGYARNFATAQIAFEDSAGNVWFGLERGHILCRRASDDQWELTRLKDWRIDEDFHRWRFTEQVGGRIVLYDPEPNNDAREIRIGYFNGKSWQSLLVADVVDPRSYVQQFIPLDNGAVVLHGGLNRFDLFWPDPSLVPGREIIEMVRGLDDADPAVREKSTRVLTQRGSVVRPILEKRLNAKDVSAEAKLRIREIMSKWEMVESHVPDEFDNSNYLASRYDFKRLSGLGASNGHEAVFIACGVWDNISKNGHFTCIVRIAADGSVKVKPAEKVVLLNTQFAGELPYLDSRGQLWMGHSLLLKPDDSITAAAPPGLMILKVLGESADGKVFAKTNIGFVVYDQRVELPKGLPCAMVEERFISHRIYSQDFWVYNNLTKQLSEVVDGKFVPMKIPEGYEMGLEVHPLRDHGVLLENHDGNFYSMDDARTAGDLWLLIADDPLHWAKRLPLYQFIGDYFSYGSDGESVIWKMRFGMDQKPDDPRFEHLFCFDGAQWHDLAVEFGLGKQGIGWVRLIDGGKGILCYPSGMTGLRAFRVRDGKLEEFQIENPARLQIEQRQTRTAGKRLFFYCDYNATKSGMYCDGRFVELPFGSVPQLADSKGRVWFIQDNSATVHVWTESGIANGNISMHWGPRAMAEGPDGRVWLLHPDGLSQLRIEGNTISEVRRIPWICPKSNFSTPIIDSANGLWDFGNALGSYRYQLPPE